MRHGPPPPVKAKIDIVTGARALDVIYQNTTGRPLMVIVCAVCTRGADTNRAFIIAWVKSSSPPNTAVGANGLYDTGAVDAMRALVVFMVPNGHYYRVTATADGASTVDMDYWTEVEL